MTATLDLCVPVLVQKKPTTTWKTSVEWCPLQTFVSLYIYLYIYRYLTQCCFDTVCSKDPRDQHYCFTYNKTVNTSGQYYEAVQGPCANKDCSDPTCNAAVKNVLTYILHCSIACFKFSLPISGCVNTQPLVGRLNLRWSNNYIACALLVRLSTYSRISFCEKTTWYLTHTHAHTDKLLC